MEKRSENWSVSKVYGPGDYSKNWLFHKTWLCCKFFQRFRTVGIFFTWFLRGPHPLLFWQIASGWPNLGLESVMSAVINKCCTISSYLAVSRDFIENQRKNCRLFSLETRSSKLWFVKCTKMIKKIGIHFLKSYL